MQAQDVARIRTRLLEWSRHFFAGLERTSYLATGICLLSVGVGFLCAGVVSMKTSVGLLSPRLWIFCKDLVRSPSDSNITIFPLHALYRRMVLQL